MTAGADARCESNAYQTTRRHINISAQFKGAVTELHVPDELKAAR